MAEDPQKGILQRIFDFLGFFKKPESQEEAATYANRQEKFNETIGALQKGSDELKSKAEWVPFLGPVTDISQGAVKRDRTQVVLGMASLVGDALGGGVKAGTQIGTKLDYLLGKATGSIHNVERSTGMLKQLESIGIFDNIVGRSFLNSHLEEIYRGSSGILQSNGRYLRESLLMGPNGGLKVISIWEENRLITVKLLGGK